MCSCKGIEKTEEEKRENKRKYSQTLCMNVFPINMIMDDNVFFRYLKYLW